VSVSRADKGGKNFDRDRKKQYTDGICTYSISYDAAWRKIPLKKWDLK